MNVVLLAAGFATRLHPLTLHRAKPLLDVAGRPVLSWILDRVLELDGLDRCLLVSNHRFAAHFDAFARDRDHQCPITVLDDGAESDATRLGAIRDLALALDRLPEDEPVLVVGGDNLLDFDLRPFQDRFRAVDAPLLLARRIDGPVPPRRYSEVTFDETGNVIEFREKPADPKSSWSCVCLYFFPSGIRSDVQNYLAAGGDPDAPGHLLAWLSTRRRLVAVPFSGPWFDIGNLETLTAARDAFERRERKDAP